MSQFNIIVSTAEATVVSEYEPQQTRSDAYQSEAALEAAFIKQLTEQGYTYLPIHSSDELVANLREQLDDNMKAIPIPYKFTATPLRWAIWVCAKPSVTT